MAALLFEMCLFNLLVTILSAMKRIFAITSFACLVSCNSENKKQAESMTETSTTAQTKKPLPEFAYPVVMANWTMGDPNNTKTVLAVYKAWEQKDSAVFADSFADTAIMDMPDARRLDFTKGKAARRLYKARNQYGSIS